MIIEINRDHLLIRTTLVLFIPQRMEFRSSIFFIFFAFLKAFFGAFWCTNRFCVFFFFFFVFFLKGTVAFCTGIHLYFLC